MQDPTIIHFRPRVDGPLSMVLLVFAGLLLAAVAVELWRKRRARRRRLAGLWKNLDEIVKERELTESERKLLIALIKRWAPNEPHRVVSIHQEFDACVSAEMESLRKRGSLDQFVKMGTVLRDIRNRLGLDMAPIGMHITSTRQLYSPQELWFTDVSEDPPRWKRGRCANVDEAFFTVRMAVDVEPPRFEPGAEVRFRLYRDEDARYMFTARFVKLETEPPGLLFEHAKELVRIQSREHYRVRHEQAATIGVMDGPLERTFVENAPRRIVTRLRGKIVNISAGGFALILPQAVPSQVLIRVNVDLELEAVEPFDVDARIVAISPLPAGRYLVRAAFVHLEDDKRDIIARYVMHRQQQQHEHVAQAG